ncbi:hypothetical protein ISF6_1926 [Piscinibacter sakaiensis]|uniref:Uncharacterized protein n=1 Tax=Piscinibacter sakaiensis TaxID=1547922 RepID=A0A0K8P0C7_PISS1|nr:hypothetical protein ISF6_1926 [Piscinibacter sakaiensis]
MFGHRRPQLSAQVRAAPAVSECHPIPSSTHRDTPRRRARLSLRSFIRRDTGPACGDDTNLYFSNPGATAASGAGRRAGWCCC